MSKAERRMTFSACALNGGIVYGFTNFGGIPIKIDLANEKMVYITDLKNYQSFRADVMLSDDENIFASELNGRRMMRYNIKKNECFYYDIDCGKRDWGNYAVFANYKGSIYVFPAYANKIVKVDLRSGKVRKDVELYSKINECQGHGAEDFTYFYCGCQLENTVWLFQRRGNLAVAYDMETDTWKEFRLSLEIENCEHVIGYADKLYILCSEGKIYSWNKAEESVEKVADCSDMVANSATFSRIVVTGKRIFLLPALGEDIFLVDLNTKQVDRYKDYPDGFGYCCPEGWGKYYGYCEEGDDCYFAMRSANYMLCLNKRTGKEKWIKYKPLSYEEYITMYIKYNKSLLSEKECQIEDVLNYYKSDSSGGLRNDVLGVGERIWRQVQ